MTGKHRHMRKAGGHAYTGRYTQTYMWACTGAHMVSCTGRWALRHAGKQVCAQKNTGRHLQDCAGSHTGKQKSAGTRQGKEGRHA